MIVPFVSACSESGRKPSNTTHGGTETSYDGYVMKVPKQNHNGATFTILSCEGENAPTARYWTQFEVEEDSADPLDSALFRRNASIEDYLGIKLVVSKRLANVVDTSAYRIGVEAGDDEFQLAAFIDRFALALAMDGLAYSYNELEGYGLDLDNPWWDQAINSQLSVLNKQYLAAGAYQLDLFGAMTVLAFNKSIAEDIHAENIYDLVRNGTWTMEKMAGMMQLAADDIDGDTQMTEDDQWGAVAAGAQWSQSFFPVSGETIIKKNKKDEPYLAAANNRKLLNILEYQCGTLQKDEYYFGFDGEGKTFTASKYWDGMVYTSVINMFANDKALFASAAPMYLNSSYMRSMENNFGIVPYPMYEEVKAGTGYGAFMPVLITHIVPFNTPDPSLAASFLEYAAYISYEKVVPTFEETIISIKGTRDEESGEMLAMMRENRKVDLCRTYFLNTAQTALNEILKYGSSVWAWSSGWAKHESNINNQIESVVDAFGLLK